jgi:hypothetical protein
MLIFFLILFSYLFTVRLGLLFGWVVLEPIKSTRSY